MSDEYKGFPTEDGNNMEIPTMYCQGLNMSPEDIMDTRPSRSSECRTGSSRSKRKRRGQDVETMEVTCSAMEYANDQLKAIAECQNLARQDESATRSKVVR